MTREEKENAIHCLKVMIDEEVCEECKLYGTTGTDHCEADCVRLAIDALEQKSTTENDLAVDCISRTDAKKYLSAPDENGDRVIYEDDLDLLPPVSPDLHNTCTPTCTDAISRQEVLELLEDTNNGWIINEVSLLPPVTPQEPITAARINGKLEEFANLQGSDDISLYDAWRVVRECFKQVESEVEES